MENITGQNPVTTRDIIKNAWIFEVIEPRVKEK
jgi:hypothetical protein